MAFKIGKKKDVPADDWSDSALAPDAPVASEPADAFGADIAADTAPPRKNLAPIMLAAGAVLLLTAIGLGVYFLFLNKPAQDADMPIVATQPGAPLAPGADPAMPDSANPAIVPAKPPLKKPVKVVTTPAKPVDDPTKISVNPTGNVIIKVKPGRAGIALTGTTTPSVQSQSGKPAAAVPKPNMPRPIPVMPDGVAGQQGKGLPPASAVPVVRPTPTISPVLKSQLVTLWQQGAAAKHRGDKAAAKSAWQKMLRLRPGHPGVQEAIDKLN